jgi:hypothetical protein
LTGSGRKPLFSSADSIVDQYLSHHPADEGGSFTSVKALLLAQRKRGADADDAISRCSRTGQGLGHFHHTAYNIGSTYAALNKPDEAVKWLEAAADDGFPCYPYFEKDPNLDSLRNKRKFIDLMSGLQKQWKRFKQIA